MFDLTPFPSVLFVFHGKSLLSLNPINRYMTSTSEKFLKNKDIVESNILISENYSFNVTHIAAVSI